MLALTTVGCQETPMKNINQVKEKHETKLMGTPGVVGVAIGEQNGKPCITVLVDGGASKTAKFPSSLEGFPVVVQQTGPIQAQPKN